MAKNLLLLRKKRGIVAKSLTEKRSLAKAYLAEEKELNAQLRAVEDEIPDDLEAKIDALTDKQAALDAEISALENELQDLDDQLAEAGVDGGSDPEDGEARSGNYSASRSVPVSEFRSRSNCFGSRAQRDAFFANGDIREFLQRVRSMGVQHRSVKGAELSIPAVMLDLIRDNLHKYSKLLAKVRLRPVSGRARQLVIGKIPEGVWMEMVGCLNELEFSITEMELEGYTVGGYVPIPNYVLKDSDIALGEELMYGIGQAIGIALDKAILFGLGRDSHMPVGILTRLAQTSQPSYWGANQGAWIDLHSTNIIQLNLASQSGIAFFGPLLTALAKAKPTYTTDGKFWVMNEATKQDIRIRAMAFNSNAALVSGLEDTMPVAGGEIVTLEFLPDNFIAGGYGGEYLLVEREGAAVEYSTEAMWKCNHTVFKGYARYDGQPIAGEAFVAVTYDNSAVTTAVTFARDYVNSSPNSLVVTSAAGTASGDTVLTVSAAVSQTNALKYFVGAPAAIGMGDKPGKEWKDLVSGTTQVTAATGSGVTVVELDGAGRVISIGYCASVTAKT